MKTDKLYYRIFLAQPELLAELLPGVSSSCQYDYSAPVIKETEFRLDGLLTPLSDDPQAPVIFVEAQMQRDPEFYARFFAQLYLYRYQYPLKRPWRGLLILQSRQQTLGDETDYSDLQTGRVQRLYLQDLLGQHNLSSPLSLFQLLVLPTADTPQAVQTLLVTARQQGEQAFQQTLDLVEAILINKFPHLSIEAIEAMLDLKTADVRQTRFYQEAYQEGQQEQGQSLILRQLARQVGSVPTELQTQIESLTLVQLETLGEALLQFKAVADLEAWLLANKS
ncbi:MAG: DUF2887 domain-containing protein [Cyanobacteria bacterium P01_H01_bin.121]